MFEEKALPNWRVVLRNNFTCWHKLADFLELSEAQRSTLNMKSRFPLWLPMRLAAKIQKGTLNDPLLKQFLPTLSEQHSALTFVDDPTGDRTCSLTPKLLHKYQGRALLLCTSACAMHCRYCFRQHFPYERAASTFEREIEAITADNTISEVILSGGDPLSLSDKALHSLFERLGDIAHVRRLRIHTRFPMGIPERIDSSFLQIMGAVKCQLWVVLHANHPREFDSDILNAIAAMRRLGITVLNQAVLLRNVNDELETLKNLCELLVDNGILPYYLHQLDRVQGASHFEVSESEGKRLIEALRALLPGYAVPNYVREIAGQISKTPL